ncbi:unnamed protein product, partial [Closterium sp. Yama58-4]
SVQKLVSWPAVVQRGAAWRVAASTRPADHPLEEHWSIKASVASRQQSNWE